MTKRSQFEGGELGEGQGADKFATQTAREIEEALPQAPETPIERAKEIFEEDFYGPEEVSAVFGELSSEIPPIPFSEAELLESRRAGERLVFYSDKIKGRVFLGESSLTLEELDIQFREGFAHVLHNLYAGEEFFSLEKPRVGWRLVGEDAPMATQGRDATQQTMILAREVNRWLIRARNRNDISAIALYESALLELEGKTEALQEASAGDPAELARLLKELEITRLARESAVEIAYRLILFKKRQRGSEEFRMPQIAISSTVTSSGDYVCVGNGTLSFNAGFNRPDEATKMSVETLPANAGSQGFGATFARGPLE